MAKIDVKSAPVNVGTRYPAPFDEPCKKRENVRLGTAGGLTQFGVNITILKPGVWSSQRHWHEKEDEFIYVLDGECVLVADEGEEILRPGDCAAFKAGVRNGHCLQNRSAVEVRVLTVGSIDNADWGEYPDIDMKFLPGRYSGGGGYVKKDGSPL